MIISKLSVKDFKQLRDIDIRFPEKGTFLIEGLNESGKSSLFESIYFGLFGQPLVTEEQRGNLADLINHNKDYAQVVLQLKVKDKVYKIHRRINRNRANEWRLEIFELSLGKREIIKKNKAVNQRIIDELGIDGEALLNSCFVEQKKLDKLEGMKKQDRERSLMKLLNLDKLLKLEEELKPTFQEEELLDRLKTKVELAKIQRKIPELNTQKYNLQKALYKVNFKKIYKKKLQEEFKIEQLISQIESLQKAKGLTQDKLTKAESYNKLNIYVDKIISLIEALEREKINCKELLALIENLKIKRNNLPAKIKFLQEIEFIGKRLRRLNKLQEYIHKLENYIVLQGEYQKEEKKYVQLKEELLRVEDDLKKIERLDNLKLFQSLSQQIKDYYKAEEEKRIIAEKIQGLKEKKRKSIKRLFISSISGIFILLITLLLNIIYLAIFSLILFIPLIAISIKNYKRIARNLAIQQEELIKIASKLEFYNISEKKKELEKITCKIKEEEGIELEDDKIVVELIEKLSVDGLNSEELKRKQAELLHEQGLILGSVKKLKERMQELFPELIDTTKERLQKAKALFKNYYDKLTNRASQFSLVLDREKLLAEYNRLKTEISRDNQDLQAQKEYELKKEESSKLIKNLSLQITKIQEEINNIKLNEGIITYNTNTCDLSFYLKLKQILENKLKEYNIEDLKESYQAIVKDIENRHGEISARTSQIKELNHQLDQIISLDAEIENKKEELEKEASSVSFEELAKEESKLEAKKQQIEVELGYFSQLKQQLYEKINLSEEELLNLEECEREYQAYQRELLVKSKASLIIELARKNITKEVLPYTIMNMRKILPLLTDNRYHDAHITSDYRIRVWDMQAGRYCDKNIFSGGAKDQFSLALRLAFALATLPQEHGVAPSFLFLDEPLGSFDPKRAEALIDMLTQGELFEVFQQIFVISHIYMDRSKFNYYIKLQDGIITETNII